MFVKTLVNGMLQENCYVIVDEESKELAIIDPGSESERLSQAIDNLGGKPKYILLTHGHDDHVAAVEYLADKYNIPFYIHVADEELIGKDKTVFGSIRKSDKNVEDGDEIILGKSEIKVIHTPGHTPGGVCYLVDNKLFSGDTLFQGSVGRSDFIGGNHTELINSIKSKLVPLGSGVEVYPGHGPMSTIGYEERNNPFLADFDSIF